MSALCVGASTCPSDDPVLAGVVSVFPHWKVEEVLLRAAAALCLREPAHPVDPMVPARTAVLAGVVSVFPHWKVVVVPLRAAGSSATTPPPGRGFGLATSVRASGDMASGVTSHSTLNWILYAGNQACRNFDFAF